MIFKRKATPLLLLIQGLFMITIGVFVLSDPEVSLVALTRTLGIIMLVAAVILLFSAYYKRTEPNRFMLYEGIVDGGLGLLFTLFPSILADAFIIILGIIAFLSGLLNLWMLIRIRAKITSAGFFRNSLVLLFGIFLLINPVQGRGAIGMIIGIFTLIFGVLSLYGAYKLNNKD